jgi:hypothetical protein
MQDQRDYAEEASNARILATGDGEESNALDFSAHYTVRGQSGVAWRLLGYAKEMTEESWTKNCDDPAHVFDYDAADYDEDDYDTHGPECHLFNEAEEVDDTSRVKAVMVGDDRPEIIDVDDLVLIPEDGYCRDCGQTGCTSNVYD